MLTSGMREATSHEIVIGGASNEAVAALLHFFYSGQLPPVRSSRALCKHLIQSHPAQSPPLQSPPVQPPQLQSPPLQSPPLHAPSSQSQSSTAAAPESTQGVLLSLLCLADRFCIPALHHAVNQRLLACVDESSAFSTLRVALSVPGEACSHLTAVAASLAAARFERCANADGDGLRRLPAPALAAVLQ
ncbi:unnamed protein product, partial [Closterium sp. NIES-54]